MIAVSEYRTWDAVEIARLIQTRQVSASEVLERAIVHAESVNPQLNAIVIPMFEIARERARAELHGPFAGVPFLIKDLFQEYAGVPSSAGCAAWRRANVTPLRHDAIVERWLKAGTVIFGRTNTPEFGSKGTTEPTLWGATRNPWALSHSPGGSSGGAAAAVAAGIVPMAGASDGGGSIRIPASCTGLFGFKPGRGRTPTGPNAFDPMHGAAVNHVLSRSVRDSALMLDATHGPEHGAGFKLAPPQRPYAEALKREPGSLRIAFTTASPLGTEVDAEVIAAVESCARTLARLGHHVEIAAPAIDGRALARDFCTLWFAHLGAHVQHAREVHRARDADFEMDSLAMAAVAKATSAVAYVETYARLSTYALALADFLRSYDVYMTPTMALPPPRIGAVKSPAWAEPLLRSAMRVGLSRLIPLAKDTIEQTTLENLRGTPFTQLANVTGVPAMSLPLATFKSGLPLGIQFLAGHGGEELLFSLASQLEQACPWHERRPVVS